MAGVDALPHRAEAHSPPLAADDSPLRMSVALLPAARSVRRRKGPEAAMETRTLENPAIGDRVTFVKTAEETGGAFTGIVVELAPGGGTEPRT